jgi:multiple sugar transport system ATP-binding protein
MVIRTDARVHPQAGSTVQATVTDPDHMHVFDPNTGQRFRSSSAVVADSSPVVSHDIPAAGSSAYVKD